MTGIRPSIGQAQDASSPSTGGTQDENESVRPSIGQAQDASSPSTGSIQDKSEGVRPPTGQAQDASSPSIGSTQKVETRRSLRCQVQAARVSRLLWTQRPLRLHKDARSKPTTHDDRPEARTQTKYHYADTQRSSSHTSHTMNSKKKLIYKQAIYTIYKLRPRGPRLALEISSSRSQVPLQPGHISLHSSQQVLTTCQPTSESRDLVRTLLEEGPHSPTVHLLPEEGLDLAPERGILRQDGGLPVGLDSPQLDVDWRGSPVDVLAVDCLPSIVRVVVHSTTDPSLQTALLAKAVGNCKEEEEEEEEEEEVSHASSAIISSITLTDLVGVASRPTRVLCLAAGALTIAVLRHEARQIAQAANVAAVPGGSVLQTEVRGSKHVSQNTSERTKHGKLPKLQT